MNNEMHDLTMSPDLVGRNFFVRGPMQMFKQKAMICADCDQA